LSYLKKLLQPSKSSAVTTDMNIKIRLFTSRKSTACWRLRWSASCHSGSFWVVYTIRSMP
jgi:hypothetical protein